jgi:hypothetical protein
MSDFDCIAAPDFSPERKHQYQQKKPQSLSESEANLVFSAIIPRFSANPRGQYRGRAFYRDGDNDKSLSVTTAGGGKFYDFVTGEGGDTIAFVRLVNHCDFLAACQFITDITGRPILDTQHKPAKPPFTQADLTRAELFQTGYSWWLERYLTRLKALWFVDEQAIPPDQIYQTTQLFECVREWSTYTTVQFLREFKPAHRTFVNECIAEAEEAQLELARAIAWRGTAVMI